MADSLHSLLLSYLLPIRLKSAARIPHPSSSTRMSSCPGEASTQTVMLLASASSELCTSSCKAEGYVGMTRLERRVVLAGRESGVIRPLEGRGGGVVIIAARMAASVGLRHAGLLLKQPQTMETARTMW